MKRFLRGAACGAAAGFLATAAAGGCSSTADPITLQPYTDMYVRAADVTGSVSCSSAPGAMRSYVLTLFDVTDTSPDAVKVAPDDACKYLADPGFSIGSSLPTPCGYDAAFGSVVPGRFYVGVVDAYDRPACLAGGGADCITPAGGESSGARTMVDASGRVVSPINGTCCGDPRVPVVDGGVTSELGPTQSLYLTQVKLAGCQPMRATGVTSVVVRTGNLAGAACGPAADQVGAFQVAGGGKTLTVACGEDATFPGVTPGVRFDASVLAFATGSTTPRWGTTCTTVPQAGTTATAVCNALTEKGAIRVEGYTCAAGATTYDVRVVGTTAVASGVACGTPAQLDGLAAGAYAITVSGKTPTGATAGSATCSALVSPGQVALASCTSGT